MENFSKETIKQPEWFPPDEKNGFYAGLNVYNSLTSSKVKFVPSSGRRVGWYICGPTTYDASHLGHARNYVTFDIIRRVLEDYFNYEIFAVMNITDVDDKIILKARRQYLFDKYKTEKTVLTEDVVKDLMESWQNYTAKLEKKIKEIAEDPELKPAEKAPELKLLQEKLAAAKKTQEEVRERIKASTGSPTLDFKIYDDSNEPLSILLDERFGSTVQEKKIFRDLAAKWEDEFMEDMKILNVKMPDVLTRVTEFIPQILEYVERIQKNGYAYVADGSVYFDTQAFAAKHPYAKLEPWSIGNVKLFNEGEGSLSLALGKKHHPNDFALWKKSKTGEPSWDSPWGPGRPGWHIECSAMASAFLGQTLDVHSGGEDLRFPHHDNELAQAEAYYNNAQWVNYFLHAGHLHIEGLKMSKSLKNFITIREALVKHSPRQLRLLFLSQPWNKVMNYSEDGLLSVKAREKTINEFFLVVRGILQDQDKLSQIPQQWNEHDLALHYALLQAQQAVDASLKDNFDTPTALIALMDIIRLGNKYMSEQSQTRKALLLRKIALYVTKILRIFGLVFEKDFASLGGDAQVEDKEKLLHPYVLAAAQFRANVRNAAIAKADPAEFLRLSDEFRNETMPPLGVRLEDSGIRPYKLDSPEVVMKEIAENKLAAAKAAKKSIDSKVRNIQSELEELEEGKLTPQDAFIKEGYKEFDQDGIPTKDSEGKEVGKNAKKKLQKALERQQKLHQKYCDKLHNDPEYINNKKKELAELQSLQK